MGQPKYSLERALLLGFTEKKINVKHGEIPAFQDEQRKTYKVNVCLLINIGILRVVMGRRAFW